MDKETAAGNIWVFVEDSLKTEIPAYFKTVLSACGYTNVISISAIEEDDLDYIKNEVRNGNVGKVFDGSKVDYLEGCSKNVNEFEFSLGHKKFLKAIVGFLKKHLAENGLESFSLNKKSNKKNLSVSKKIEEKGKNVAELIPLMDKMKFENFDDDKVLENSIQKTLTEDNIKLSLKLENRPNNTFLPFLAHQVLGSENMTFGEKGSVNKDSEESLTNDIVLKPGCYVIYCMSSKDWLHWPDVKPPVKFFVGQLQDGSNEINQRLEIELKVLKSNPYKRQNFWYPENYEAIKVSKKNILKILSNPTKNRRGELVFEDKSILDYTFH